MRCIVCGGYVGNVEFRYEVTSVSMYSICAGRVPGGRGFEATGAEVEGGAAGVDCGTIGLFSLLVSGEELAVWGSVGDEGKGGRKFSCNPEAVACGIDEGTVVVTGSGCGGGGGGGRFGMVNSS